ncbi:uncharacterized protein [Palaemon carinicauda]|uniref:uncharacterized protein n=1 Tax=Palaemon carinicauda TaxID=392227 RepID=UPI0035B61997
MVKLLLFPFALILAFTSAQADDKFYISDANNTVNFPDAASSHTFLVSSHTFPASWTSDINNEIIVEGYVNSRNNRQRLFEYIFNSSESNAWNIIEIYRTYREVIIYPGNRRYRVSKSSTLSIRITSTKKTYWRFCADIYKCDLPAPVPPATEFPAGSTTTQSSNVSSRETALNFTSMVLLSICCVLVAIVIGMAVCLIRGRRTSLNEPARNLEPENISHNPQMFNVSTFSSPQEDHESINSLYGYTINRESPK